MHLSPIISMMSCIDPDVFLIAVFLYAFVGVGVILRVSVILRVGESVGVLLLQV